MQGIGAGAPDNRHIYSVADHGHTYRYPQVKRGVRLWYGIVTTLLTSPKHFLLPFAFLNCFDECRVVPRDFFFSSSTMLVSPSLLIMLHTQRFKSIFMGSNILQTSVFCTYRINWYTFILKTFCYISVQDVLENSGHGFKLPTGHGVTKQAVL